MLLYVKEKDIILNLDNVVMIRTGGNILVFDSNDIVALGTDGSQILICSCENEEEASKIINDIYKKMTYGSENMILDLEDYRKHYRKHCIDCIKYKTDACTIWENLDPQDTICIDFLGEDGEEYGDEEK